MKIGDKVYLKPINNRARYGNEAIEEYIIKKIGRKYFEVWDGIYEFSSTKFHLENDHRQVTDYSPDWELYFSKQEILDKNECDQITKEIRDKFTGWGKVNLTLEQLRSVKQIIDGK